MPIHNYLFEIAKQERQKEENAIKYLQSRGYVISNKHKTHASHKQMDNS